MNPYSVLDAMTYVTSLSPDWRRRKSTDPQFIHPFRSLQSVNNGWLLKRLLININQRKNLSSNPKLIDRAVKHTSGDKYSTLCPLPMPFPRSVLTTPTIIILPFPSVRFTSSTINLRNALMCDTAENCQPMSVRTKRSGTRFHTLVPYLR